MLLSAFGKGSTHESSLMMSSARKKIQKKFSIMMKIGSAWKSTS